MISRSNPATVRAAAWLESTVRTICQTVVNPSAAMLVTRLAGARLNPSQARAAEAAAGGCLTLVQGPPGTGKTKVAIAILLAWVRSGVAGHGGARERAVLATSDSNIACDNLLEGLANAGVRVVRLGRSDNVRPELLQYCLDVGGGAGGGGGGGAGGGGGGGGGGPKSSEQRQAEHLAKQRLLRSAEVVVATAIGVGSNVLHGWSFPAVLMDEATQATEASALVALSRGARQLCLLGDQCQLPPTVTAEHPSVERTSRPLFSRLLDDGVGCYMLDTQYRMHPAIAELPSDLFYGGRLLTGISASDRPVLPGFSWPRAGWPVAMVPVSGMEASEGSSKSNRAEAEATALVVRRLLAAGVPSSQIGVISPYGAQVRLLRSLIRRDPPPHGGDPVEVSSVDGFQGDCRGARTRRHPPHACLCVTHDLPLESRHCQGGRRRSSSSRVCARTRRARSASSRTRGASTSRSRARRGGSLCSGTRRRSRATVARGGRGSRGHAPTASWLASRPRARTTRQPRAARPRG
jgi:hypothetical protein